MRFRAPKHLALVVAWSVPPTACNTFPPTPDPPPGPTLLGPELAGSIRETARRHGQPELVDEIEASVIDIHAHSFNARYLPIRGILLGKRDATPVAALLFDSWAKKLAAWIASSTPLAPVDGVAERLDPIRSTNRVSFGSPGEVPALDEEGEAILGLGEDMRVAFAAIEEDDTEATRMERLAAVDDAVDKLLERDELSSLHKVLDVLHDIGLLKSKVHFLRSLVTRDDDLVPRFHGDYAAADVGGEPDRVDLVVSHMMDLGPVYAQRADSVLLEPFALGQVPRMEHYQQQPDADMLYFVAYNPFRDNRHAGGKGGDAMRIVERAIETQGAWGVKVYPPSGYRPARNVLPKRPCTTLSNQPAKQWDGRYLGVSNDALDRRLDALFAYCSENDVPIFTHCSTGEFEARKGYSVHHADPRWWRPALEKYPELRLCFGHAGGSSFWFDTGAGHEDWGRLVYELCVQYKNVYCEFGVHAELVENQESRRFFLALLDHLIANPLGKYPFEGKILYGSDWYMPRAVDEQSDFLQAYKRAFCDPRLSDHYGAFFWRNAMAYLDVEDRLAATSIPANVREDLEALLDQ